MSPFTRTILWMILNIIVVFFLIPETGQEMNLLTTALVCFGVGYFVNIDRILRSNN